MKIIFLIKFYQPFDRGGSEWSTHDLAKLFTQKGHQVTILTPNYGTKSFEVIEKIQIHRFPFVKKLKDPKSPITPWWTNNIFWFIYTSLYISWFVFKNKPDIIHIHSNEFIPSGVLAGKLNKKPSVVTFRDYQALCNLGFCLWEKDKTCKNLGEYLRKDFNFFYQNYIYDKSPFKYFFLQMAAVHGWVMQKIVYFFAKQISTKVAVSQKVAKIFTANGLDHLRVINNPVIMSAKLSERTSTEIIYIGRLSKGKGVDMLLDAFLQICGKLRNVKLKIIGSGVLAKELERKIKEAGLGSRIILTGQLNHDQVLEQIKKAALVVTPSIWPEPLPRSAIESLLSGIPVVATKRGGITEVVKNNRYGVLVSPNKNSLAKEILAAYTKRE